MSESERPQLSVTDNGTTWSFRAVNDAGRTFLHNLGAESWQFLGPDTLVVDHRPARDLQAALEENGEVDFVE